ncbi:hypothetical protein PM082_009699 [Marasmius tenuissimus]|nr:hypothetical protein PM082_009699 [Marasmius tenuissimus]
MNRYYRKRIITKHRSSFYQTDQGYQTSHCVAAQHISQFCHTQPATRYLQEQSLNSCRRHSLRVLAWCSERRRGQSITNQHPRTTDPDPAIRAQGYLRRCLDIVLTSTPPCHPHLPVVPESLPYTSIPDGLQHEFAPSIPFVRLIPRQICLSPAFLTPIPTSIIYTLFERSASLNIGIIPAQTKRDDVATLVSAYQAVDPLNFAFAVASTSFSSSEDSLYVGPAESENQTDMMKAEFLKDEGYDSMFQLGIQLTLGTREIFAVAAYDIETLSASELQRRADGECHPITPGMREDSLPPQPGSCFGLGSITGGSLTSKSPETTTRATGSPNTHPSTNTLPNPPATSTTPFTLTAPGGQFGSSGNPSQRSTPALVSVTPSMPSTPNTNTNSGEGTNENPHGTLAADVSATLSGQTSSQHGSPNTQNSHQQGNPTSTSAEPSTALPSGTPPVTRKPNVGTIIGAVLGALALLILVLLVILYCRRRRKIHQDKRSKPAVEPTTVFRSCFWRRDRDAEGSCQRDEDAGAVSSYTVAGPGLGSIPEKCCLDVPASYVAPQETEDRGTDIPESVGVDEPNMDVYLRLDMMSRDLADLRRMMHDARGLEEALPEYSSQ